MEEIWKPIKDYEGLYEISSIWSVKSLHYWREKILKLWMQDQYSIILLRNILRKKYRVHRLVAQAFIPNPDNLPCVLHKDETLDENWLLYNWIDNLFWWTQSDNLKDMVKKWRDKNHFQTVRHPNKWKFWKYSKSAKKANQYSLSWELIKKWYSLIDAQRELWIEWISKCCRGKQKTAWWFIWKFN